jgi:FAD/FMN-containing dehydrogenase
MSEAKVEGIKVKAVGGCASLEAVATTHGVLIETYKLTSIEEEMRQINGKRAFWLGAGVTVSQAIEYLREQNMALADNGGWTGQTIVGAVMTGTRERSELSAQFGFHPCHSFCDERWEAVCF